MHEWHEYDNVTVAYYIDAMQKKCLGKLLEVPIYIYLSKHLILVSGQGQVNRQMLQINPRLGM